MRNELIVIALLCCVFMMACTKKEQPAASHSASVERLNPTPPPIAKKGKTSSGERIVRPILVGGCGDDCERPDVAFKNFIRKVLQREGVTSVQPYINSAILIHNGKKHGERWAQLFLSNETGKRAEEITQWLTSWLTWVDRVVDPADRDKYDAGVKVVEHNQKRFVVEYTHPEFQSTGDTPQTGAIWRIVLKPRGLEWLVAEIDENAIVPRVK